MHDQKAVGEGVASEEEEEEEHDLANFLWMAVVQGKLAD